MDLRLALAATSLLAVACYLTAALAEHPVIALLGCAVSGLAVAIMWPGVLSLGARILPHGGTVMFALFAFSGDLGCTSGPGLISLLADDSAAGIRRGLLWATAFPLVMLITSLCLYLRKKNPPSR